MSIFQAELYDKVHKKVMSNGPIEEIVNAYNMAMLTMNGEFEIRPHKKLQNGKDYTFDVVFVNKTDEVHMNLNTILMECATIYSAQPGNKERMLWEVCWRQGLGGR